MKTEAKIRSPAQKYGLFRASLKMVFLFINN